MDDIKKLIADSVADMHAAAKRLEESEMFAIRLDELNKLEWHFANSSLDGEAKAEIARYTIERVKEIIS